MEQSQHLLALADRMLWVTALVAAPVLLATLAIGLVVGIIQAATSVNEQTLTFVPKLAVTALVLVLFGLRTRGHETAVALSGLVQSAGYGLAALMPLAIGLTHELTGGWVAALVVLGAAIACAVPAGLIVARRETIEDAWERRTGRSW